MDINQAGSINEHPFNEENQATPLLILDCFPITESFVSLKKTLKND